MAALHPLLSLFWIRGNRGSENREGWRRTWRNLSDGAMSFLKAWPVLYMTWRYVENACSWWVHSWPAASGLLMFGVGLVLFLSLGNRHRFQKAGGMNPSIREMYIFGNIERAILVVQTCNPNTPETETRGLQVQGQPRQVKNDNRIKVLPLKRIKIAPRTYVLFLMKLNRP